MRLLLAVLLLATPLVAAPVPKSVKKPAVSYDGKWKLVEFSWDGEQGVFRNNMVTVWTVEGETMYIGPKGATNVTHKLLVPDPAKPNVRQFGQIDTRPALLELDGDTLKFCVSLSSAEVKECVPGKGVNYYSFTRLPADAQEPYPPK